MGWVTRYLVIQDGLSEFVGRAISWLTLAMIAVLMLEIIARYFLNSPTIWAHEMSTMLYGGFCILAGAFTLRHGGHVRSEVIWGMLGERARATCDVIIFAIGLLVMGIFFVMAVEFAAESWAVREYSNKSIWQPALYPIKTVIPVAVGLVWLQNLAEFLRAFLTMLGIDFEDPRDGEDSSQTDPEYVPEAQD
ncbi:TRAP transporter small permease subunit [Aliiroseovarius crassostreae]|uniref:TRAP transporter small permease protein n=1 Tax=Aliiroseovarius crassostreae TaxID=154981 RepID=A0A0P7III1_9RHOB|nr:TRAP transporter small permease subunit [Aliiroseovarius crassostreae]KPN63607.1 C4-dicarboxylate ABC transporter substrate-binding protein [Aliiroseovarius crassostreae]UWP88354.1 TRAP transporter small permease subunit [Aliiroseovarius crassostreae]UWQ07285.1 TRAP transporter small permease subunit [Aliiroseovarius crassostreae]UWQ10395.1 TRAP transporter small permease subunit [Aliiroseovarius crassostreae]SFU90008.1 TRAP-type mannitol/chloroaromatic compound transport system, small perm